MDDDSPVAGAGSVLTRKLGPLPLWVWGVAGAVILWLVAGRRGTPAALATAQTVSQEQALAEQLALQQAQERAKQQSALDALQFRAAEQQFGLQTLYGDLETYRVQRAIQTERAFTDAEGRVKFQCPPGQGSLKRDPQTGQLYCRAKARKGNTFTDILGPVSQIIGLYTQPQGGVLQ